MKWRNWLVWLVAMGLMSIGTFACGNGEDDDRQDTGPSDAAMDVEEDVMDVEEDIGEDVEEDIAEDVEEDVADVEEDVADVEEDIEEDIEEDVEMDIEEDVAMDIEEDAPSIGPPGVGDVIVTEFMANPEALADSTGEYFELYNTSATQDFELDGCVIEDLGSDSHTIDADGGSFVIPAEGYVTLANSDMPGFASDYNYGGSWFLSNSGDEIQLSCGGTVIDTVDYDSGPNWAGNGPTEGAAKGLNPTMLDATSNDDGDNWCDQTTELPNTADNGTPGAANDPCT